MLKMLNNNEIQFILENSDADILKLIMSSSKKDNIDNIDIKLCINCIEARNKIKNKVPEWYNEPALIYPLKLSIEQCSSQITATYKQTIINSLNLDKNFTIADITGGLGVDSYYLSKIASRLLYFDKNEILCSAAKNNFKLLNANNITIVNADITENLYKIKNENISLIYADPARRAKDGKKVSYLMDCEPNILEIKNELLKISPYILLKLSPMADIKQNLSLLPETIQVYIVSVNNECKELLFLLSSNFCSGESNKPSEPIINAIDISTNNNITNKISFNFCEESAIVPLFSTQEAIIKGSYLYEPNKSILKAGAFKYIGEKYNLKKISPSTHLYVSDTLDEFPGKVFRIDKVYNYNKHTIKELEKSSLQANLCSKNFPISTDNLKKRLKIKDGGDLFIFAVTSMEGNLLLIFCYPIK